MAAALIDRLVHRWHIVNIQGNSYRLRVSTPTSLVAFAVLLQPPKDM